MPGATTKADGPDAAALQLNSSTRRASLARWCGGLGLAMAGVAGLGAIAPAVLASGHVIGGIEVLSDLPDLLVLTPIALGAAAGLMLIAAVLAALSQRQLERAGELELRSSLLRVMEPPGEAAGAAPVEDQREAA